MQKIIFRSEIRSYSDCIDQSIINYISEESIETYESFREYSLVAFDWFDPLETESEPVQILLYLDREDLFIICENETAAKAAAALFEMGESNERVLYLGFRNLLRGRAQQLEQVEDQISELDDCVMNGASDELRGRIHDMKDKTLRLRKFYEPVSSVLGQLCINENDLLSEECVRSLANLLNRAEDLCAEVHNLREYLSQVRDSYQSQIGIEQNNIMKVFTLVTSIFLPLTLLVGWYGMNFPMPELSWRFGYAGVIVLSIVICIVWFLVARRRRWFR